MANFTPPPPDKPESLLEALCLASLRKKALQRNKSLNLTPGALVEADRKLIRELIASETAVQSETHVSAPESKYGSISEPAIWLPVSLAGIMPLLAVTTGLSSAWVIAACAVSPLLIIASLATQQAARKSTTEMLSRRLHAFQKQRMVQASDLAASQQAPDSRTDGTARLIEQCLDELTKLEIARKESERLLTDFNERGLVTMNDTGVIGQCNLTFCDMVNSFSEKLKGKTLASLIVPESRDRLLNVLQEHSKHSTVDVQLLSTLKGVNTDIRCTLEWSESLNLFYCSFEDVSAEKEIERLKARFQTIISHDLRTPLASLKLSVSESLKQDDLPESCRSLLLRSERSALRLITLVEDLLTLYSAESGTLKPVIKITEASAIISDAIDSLASLFTAANIRIERMDTASFFVLADHERSAQIISNYLSNVISYCPSETVVSIDCRKVENFVQLRITDNGPGIAPEKLSAVFDHLTSAPNPTNAESRALGLPNCKILAEVQGGKVGASSQVGEGSTFWLMLPLAEEKEIDESFSSEHHKFVDAEVNA